MYVFKAEIGVRTPASGVSPCVCTPTYSHRLTPTLTHNHTLTHLYPLTHTHKHQLTHIHSHTVTHTITHTYSHSMEGHGRLSLIPCSICLSLEPSSPWTIFLGHLPSHPAPQAQLLLSLCPQKLMLLGRRTSTFNLG